MTSNNHPWQPIGNLSNPVGFIAPAKVQTNLKESDFKELSQTASEILKNPLSVRQIADRVYQLMQEDLRLQSDRHGYRGWR